MGASRVSENIFRSDLLDSMQRFIDVPSTTDADVLSAVEQLAEKNFSAQVMSASGTLEAIIDSRPHLVPEAVAVCRRVLDKRKFASVPLWVRQESPFLVAWYGHPAPHWVFSLISEKACGNRDVATFLVDFLVSEAADLSNRNLPFVPVSAWLSRSIRALAFIADEKQACRLIQALSSSPAKGARYARTVYAAADDLSRSPLSPAVLAGRVSGLDMAVPKRGEAFFSRVLDRLQAAATRPTVADSEDQSYVRQLITEIAARIPEKTARAVLKSLESSGAVVADAIRPVIERRELLKASGGQVPSKRAKPKAM